MNTSSIGFPNMFDVARNKVQVYGDRASIANRVKLMLLTEPTELYMNPTYGVGLKRFMFQYNNDNILAQIRDRLVDQLRLWEPCVKPEATQITRGLLYSEHDSYMQDVNDNHLKLTIAVQSIYGDTINIQVNDNELSW